MYRCSAIVLALLVGAQALGSREAFMVCRYTGKVMEAPCPCPPKEHDGAARLQREDCCEIRKAEPFENFAAVSPAKANVDCAIVDEVELASAHFQADRDDASELESHSPLGRWRYLSLRQLLI